MFLRSLRSSTAVLVSVSLLSLTLCSCTKPPGDKLVPEAEDVILPAAPFMGDWQADWGSSQGFEIPLVAQVIALGDRIYQANLLTEFDKRIPPIVVFRGRLEDKKVVFRAQSTQRDGRKLQWRCAIKDNKFAGSFEGSRTGTFAMKKIVRLSPTLGAEPPAGAILLFDGTNIDHWEHPNKSPAQWKLVDGAMEVWPAHDSSATSIVTKRKFSDFKLHLEFRTPFIPEARGQSRGNSGVYLQERYEVQILDSYGLEGLNNQCGGVYKIAAPQVNMCAPPMQWQSYDITFHAPRFDSDGRKIKNVRLTVLHNGVKIHDDIEVPKPTGRPTALSPHITQPGGIYLQDHGNRVQYRNIWLVELPE